MPRILRFHPEERERGHTPYPTRPLEPLFLSRATLYADPLERHKETSTVFRTPEAWDLRKPKVRQPIDVQRKRIVSEAVRPSGADRRLFHPERGAHASTIYGTPAMAVAGHFLGSLAYPCVQRTMRRQVMFAAGHAGKGYRTRKRRTWTSSVEC